jgi:two-component system sensor histidine kinase CiaH
VSNASHELRTPLAIVQNRLENILAKSNKTVYEVSSDIAISLKEISRLSKLTNDLLLLAKSDNEALEINYEEFNLYKLIEDVSTPFAEMAEIDNKNFILEGEDIVVNADRSKIAQVLIILLDNALNYTQSGESITIEISQMNNDVLIKVKDTGVGIDNLTKKHLFERFYRADKARRRETGGNGLGLSIAQTIMKLHNGRIIVSDNYPKGSYFIVQFPKNLILKKNNTPLQS